MYTTGVRAQSMRKPFKVWKTRPEHRSTEVWGSYLERGKSDQDID